MRTIKQRECLPVLNEPRDFIGTILAFLFERELASKTRRDEVVKWNMLVTLDTDYYPVTIHFANGIRVERGRIDDPTLTLRTSVNTLVLIAQGRFSPIRGLLQGKLKMKGILRHPIATVRFYRLMMDALRG